MNQERDLKIKRYKEKKDLEEKLKPMRTLLKAKKADEEFIQEFYTALIQWQILQCQDELEAIKAERPMLEHMAKMGGQQKARDHLDKENKVKQRPLNPVVITKDAMQKEVTKLI